MCFKKKKKEVWLTDEGQEDEEGCQLHRVGIGKALKLEPYLVQ